MRVGEGEGGGWQGRVETQAGRRGQRKGELSCEDDRAEKSEISRENGLFLVKMVFFS